MKLLALFLLGFVSGVAVWWAYVRSLKQTLKTYERYIHERIDSQLKSIETPPPAPHRERVDSC